MAQFARPDSTISAGLWDPVGGPATLWECVDEVAANDSIDYIEALNGENTTCELGLSNVTDPTTNTGHIIRFKMQGTGSGGPERCQVQLFDGATLIADTGIQASRAAWGTKTYTLTATEADNIGDYTDLRFKIVSSNLAAAEDMWVTWAELEVPEASQINTRQERFSMMNFWDGSHIIMTQEVDGSVGATDRATLLDLYCGISLDPPVAGPADTTDYVPVIRRRRRM